MARLLLVSMYPLDGPAIGPSVRIARLRDALTARVELDVIAGHRPARRAALARYALSGRLRRLDGIYVEASSFLPAEADILFLALARALGLPVVTFFRDAYQLFPDWYPVDSRRRWVGARLFRPAMRALAAVSSRVAVPSAGLARAILGHDRDVLLLPPGAPELAGVPLASGARRLLFVGNGRLPTQGVPRLLRAVELARDRGDGVELTVVAPPGQEPPAPHAPWLRVVRAAGDELKALLPDTMATVIPRPRGAYNDLAVPLKLYEYLAFGRPLIVTDCTETARVVREAGCGIVVGDAPESIADGIATLVRAGPDERAAMAAAAERAAEQASWPRRAAELLEALGIAA